MQPLERLRYTEEQYLAMENQSEVRHELINGDIYAMSGASFAHNLIASNITRRLGNALEAARRPCLVVQSDQRVYVPPSSLYTYPDVTVVCGRPQFHTKDPLSLVNPIVIFEVLSDSTQDYDRGAKFDHYRLLPSLTEVLFVSQSERRVEQRRKQDDSRWTLEWVRADRVHIAALDVELSVDEIYAGVELPAERPLQAL